MDYFKKQQNSWLRYGNCVFVLCFKICPRGVDFKIRATFLCFLKMEVFCVEFTDLIFEDRLLIIFQEFIFSISNISMPKDLFEKPQKSQNNVLPNTGYYGSFQKWSKFVTQVWIEVFVVRLQICTYGLAFKISWGFCVFYK